MLRISTKVSKILCYLQVSITGCNASLIGETTRHLTTRIKEHLEINSKSHIVKHPCTCRNFKALRDTEWFEIIDSATSSWRLKLTIAEQTSKTRKCFYNYLIPLFNCFCLLIYLFNYHYYCYYYYYYYYYHHHHH